MSLTVLSAPEATESVVTITVHITLNGDELPPAATRLIHDLEALAGLEARTQVQLAGQLPAGAVPQRAAAAPVPGRALRLVEPAADPIGDAPRVRRIGRSSGS